MTSEIRYYAHSLPPPHGREDWESLSDHAERVADGEGDALPGASQFAKVFGTEEWGRLLGLWPDLGRYSIAFQDYLAAGAGVRNTVHGSEMLGRVDHSTVGAQHAGVRNPSSPLGVLLAYCIRATTRACPTTWVAPPTCQCG